MMQQQQHKLSHTKMLEITGHAIGRQRREVDDEIAVLTDELARIERRIAALGSGGEVRGTFEAGTQYRRGDMVALDGQSWIARHDHPASKPGTDEAWQLCAKRGPKGKDGKDGRPGKDGVGIADIHGEKSAIVFAMTDGQRFSIDIAQLVQHVLNRNMGISR